MSENIIKRHPKCLHDKHCRVFLTGEERYQYLNRQGYMTCDCVRLYPQTLSSQNLVWPPPQRLHAWLGVKEGLG